MHEILGRALPPKSSRWFEEDIKAGPLRAILMSLTVQEGNNPTDHAGDRQVFKAWHTFKPLRFCRRRVLGRRQEPHDSHRINLMAVGYSSYPGVLVNLQFFSMKKNGAGQPSFFL
jgi:hypothetical protein